MWVLKLQTINTRLVHKTNVSERERKNVFFIFLRPHPFFPSYATTCVLIFLPTVYGKWISRSPNSCLVHKTQWVGRKKAILVLRTHAKFFILRVRKYTVLLYPQNSSCKIFLSKEFIPNFHTLDKVGTQEKLKNLTKLVPLPTPGCLVTYCSYLNLPLFSLLLYENQYPYYGIVS